MSGEVIDVNNLGSIFGVQGSLDNGSLTTIPSNESKILSEIDSSEDKDFDDQLKDLLENANSIMSAAKYLISTTPDAESIAAAASLLASINGIVSEFRKTTQMKKRFEYQKQLELLKIQAREKLQQEKIKADKEKIQIGDGNTINIQNNNMIPFSQEQVVNIIEERRKLLPKS
jgi:hypothetical protein